MESICSIQRGKRVPAISLCMQDSLRTFLCLKSWIRRAGSCVIDTRESWRELIVIVLVLAYFMTFKVSLCLFLSRLSAVVGTVKQDE